MPSSVTGVTASNLSGANGTVLNEGDVVEFTLAVRAATARGLTQAPEPVTPSSSGPA